MEPAVAPMTSLAMERLTFALLDGAEYQEITDVHLDGFRACCHNNIETRDA